MQLHIQYSYRTTAKGVDLLSLNVLADLLLYHSARTERTSAFTCPARTL